MNLILDGQGNDDLAIIGRPLKVFLAVPLRDEWRGVDRTIFSWVGFLSRNKHKIVAHVEEPIEPVELARNTIAGRFLRTDCDALLMIDQDQRPQSSADQLLDSLADVTAGMTLMARTIPDGQAKRRGLAVPAMRASGGGPLAAIEPFSVGDQDVDTVGFGAVLIKRRVLEDRRLWMSPEFADPYTGAQQTIAGDPEEPPAIFRTLRKPNGRTLYGEDFDFCLRAKALGYSVAVQMNARFGHVKPNDLMVVAGMGDEAAGQPSGFVLCGNTVDVGG